MRKQSFALLAGLVVAGTAAVPTCWADETPQPQPIAPGGHVAGTKTGNGSRPTVVASPTVSQTTVVRMADGSLGMVCEQKRNPASTARTNSTPAPERQQ